jgi:hypothetical protein
VAIIMRKQISFDFLKDILNTITSPWLKA